MGKSKLGSPGGAKIPVMRPLLPSHVDLAPYFQSIDDSRTYTNFGPLHRRLESRLAEYFGVRDDEVLLLANGTLALQGAVETAATTKSSWLMPSWTFVASAEAVSSAGRGIIFGDIDSASWRLTVNPVSDGQPLVMVAPFGDDPDISSIRIHAPRSPVIVDAASCFDACRGLSSADLSNAMVMVSLHATKLVTTGEGGVLVGDSQWINDVKRWSNFGFRGRRIADVRGTNAKLSEYSAAVGLASLDRWLTTRVALAERAERYKSQLNEVGVSVQPALERGKYTSTMIARFVDSDTRDRALYALSEADIETRAWWSEGVHRMDSFADCQWREQLTMTELLAGTTLGLPFFVDMTTSEIDRISEAIAKALE